jgi:hypothetical protein
MQLKLLTGCKYPRLWGRFGSLKRFRTIRTFRFHRPHLSRVIHFRTGSRLGGLAPADLGQRKLEQDHFGSNEDVGETELAEVQAGNPEGGELGLDEDQEEQAEQAEQDHFGLNEADVVEPELAEV